MSRTCKSADPEGICFYNIWEKLAKAKLSNNSILIHIFIFIITFAIPVLNLELKIQDMVLSE